MGRAPAFDIDGAVAPGSWPSRPPLCVSALRLPRPGTHLPRLLSLSRKWDGGGNKLPSQATARAQGAPWQGHGHGAGSCFLGHTRFSPPWVANASVRV